MSITGDITDIVHVPLAQLRVYEPLTALGEVERISAQSAIERDRALSRTQVGALERRVALAQLRSGPMPDALVASVGAVEVRRVGNRVHVCPLLLERRVAQAVVRAHRELRPGARQQLLGTHAPAAAERVLQHVDRRLFVREHAWTVPLAWFLAFEATERHGTAGDGVRSPRVSYLTQVGPARQRLAGAGETLRAHVVTAQLDLTLDVERFHTWLLSFDETALLELDYGSIAAWLGPSGVAAERTLERLRAGLAALRDEDLVAAGREHSTALSYWSRLRGVAGSN